MGTQFAPHVAEIARTGIPALNPNQVLYLGSARHTESVRCATQDADLPMHTASSPADMLSRLSSRAYSVAVVELGIADLDASEFLECVRKLPVPVMVVFLLGETAASSEAVRLVRQGAYHCTDARTSVDELSQLLEQAVEEFRSRTQSRSSQGKSWRDLIVGESKGMQEMIRMIELVAPRRCTVLITGETGTGKEVCARAIHQASDRSQGPWVAINCSAIPENLLEAELFGHTKGAFTGAAGARMGRFEEANNGTLFLDEIGDMPLDLQAKLLRVLQERELQRLGSSETVKVNVRVVAASNRDLLERVKQGKFREDLYYRLNVVPIHMPALRERHGDVRLLARHFVAKICRLEGIPVKEVFNETLEHLAWYSWPGNVRQLENLVEKAVVMSGDRSALLPGDFSLPAEAAKVEIGRSIQDFSVPDEGIDFVGAVTSFERNIVDQALLKTNGNKTLAADLLRLKRTTLISKLRVLGLGVQ